jgi:predicted XRE-type DNA-binding protein
MTTIGGREARLLLVRALNEALDGRVVRQADAARLLGVSQSRVSALRRYRVDGFSVERLMRLLTLVDRDVEIVVRSCRRSDHRARITVVAR